MIHCRIAIIKNALHFKVLNAPTLSDKLRQQPPVPIRFFANRFLRENALSHILHASSMLLRRFISEANQCFCHLKSSMKSHFLNKKTIHIGIVLIRVWGAIRESDPFMSGSQPDVLTVSPIAPRLRYDRCVADYSQGKNSQSANSNF